MGENEKKERYLLISSAESGYQKEITEFFENALYNKDGEYYDHLQPVGSIYPLLYHFGFSKSESEKELEKAFSILYENLKISVGYLVSCHDLSKIVIVSEPECVLYKDMCNYCSDYMMDKFSNQKKALHRALESFENILFTLSIHLNFRYPQIEAWYMNVADNSTEGFKDIIFHKVRSNEMIQLFFEKEG